MASISIPNRTERRLVVTLRSERIANKTPPPLTLNLVGLSGSGGCVFLERSLRNTSYCESGMIALFQIDFLSHVSLSAMMSGLACVI